MRRERHPESRRRRGTSLYEWKMQASFGDQYSFREVPRCARDGRALQKTRGPLKLRERFRSRIP
jgi:hypothetical protein